MIEAQAAPGGGSVFTVTLPAVKAASAKPSVSVMQVGK
jgi:signal transduction histidine kinase